MTSGKKYPFSSTHVEMSSDVMDAFLEKGKKIVDKPQLYKPDDRFYGLTDNPHITVLYGIHAEHPSVELMDIVETYPKFTITLGNVSLFKGSENNNPFDVIKTDINCPDLHALNTAFKECGAFTSDYPDYEPHATVAYVQPDTHDHLKGLPAFQGWSFVVDKIVFSGKNGIERSIFLARR